MYVQDEEVPEDVQQTAKDSSRERTPDGLQRDGGITDQSLPPSSPVQQEQARPTSTSM